MGTLSAQIYFLVSVFSSIIPAASNLDVLKVRVESLIDQNKCDEAWNYLWFHSKKNDEKARQIMASVIAGGVIAPKFLISENSLENITLIYLYAVTNEEDVYAKIAKEAILESSNIHLKDFIKLCFKENKKKQCVIDAIENNIMPSFAEFALAVDALNMPGGICLRKAH